MKEAITTKRKSSGLVLLLAFLVIKLTLASLIFQQPQNAFLPDSVGYEDLALNIQSGRFDVPGNPALGTIRTPGYPMLIAAIYAVVGRVPGWVTLIQLMLDGLTMLLVWQIGRQLFYETVGLMGAFIAALSLNATAASLYLLSDTLFTFLLVLAVYFLSRYWRQQRNRWIGISGLVLGLAALVRPIALYLAPLWIVLVLMLHWRQKDLKQSYRGVLTLGAIFILVVAPWFWRNYALIGRLTLSTFDAMNVYCCFAPAALAEDEHISFVVARERVDAPFRLNLNQVDPERMYTAAGYATQIILQHPVGYAKAHLKGIVATLFEPTNKQWLQLLGMTYTPSNALSKLIGGDFRGAFSNLRDAASPTGLLSFAIPVVNGIYTIALYVLAGWGTF